MHPSARRSGGTRERTQCSSKGRTMTRTMLRARGGWLGAAACVALLGVHSAALGAEPTNEPAEIAEAAVAPEPADETSQSAKPADPAPRKGIEEITVTARRREEVLQNTPLSITAFSEAELEQRSIQSITDISQSTPNL